MVLDKKVAEQTVDFLTQINAIKLNTKNPFTWTSGIKSPIYCDNRLVLSYPKIREFIANSMSQIIKKKYHTTLDYSPLMIRIFVQFPYWLLMHFRNYHTQCIACFPYRTF